MNSAVKNRTEDSEYTKRREIATKAFEGGFVIFSPKSQKWYTPREFLDSDEQVVFTKAGVSDVPNVNFYYPAYAIQKRIEKLQRDENDFKRFINRVTTAFELVPKKKTKEEGVVEGKDEIIFNDTFKGKTCTFRIAEAAGSGGWWFLYIDHFYYGQLSIINDVWVFKPQKDDVFTDYQTDMILNRIRKFRPIKE